MTLAISFTVSLKLVKNRQRNPYLLHHSYNHCTQFRSNQDYYTRRPMPLPSEHTHPTNCIEGFILAGKSRAFSWTHFILRNLSRYAAPHKGLKTLRKLYPVTSPFSRTFLENFSRREMAEYSLAFADGEEAPLTLTFSIERKIELRHMS